MAERFFGTFYNNPFNGFSCGAYPCLEEEKAKDEQKEKIREYKRNYYQENIDKINEKRRNYYQENIDKIREYKRKK